MDKQYANKYAHGMDGVDGAGGGVAWMQDGGQTSTYMIRTF